MSTQRSNALKRVPVPASDDLVDEFMSYIPRGQVDLANEERRAHMREWLRRLVRETARRVAEAHAEASANAIHEVTMLLSNPEWYAEQKQRRKKRDNAQMRREEAAQREAERWRTTKEAIEAGKLTVMDDREWTVKGPGQ